MLRDNSARWYFILFCGVIALVITEELPLFPTSKLSTEDDALTLRLFLRGRDWMSAQNITFEFPQWKDRYIRKLAALSNGHVVSGQQGYKLTVECTPEEVLHGMNWLRSQAREMIGRSIKIGKVFHGAATNRTAP